jgi:GT2 family glycosyltransferase
MLTTILIITYKNEKTIDKLLNKFSNHYKVIVVENSNNLAFKKKLEKKYKNLSCILTKSNLGFSKACNIGLKKIKSKYALLLSSDVDINHLKINKIERIATKINNFAIIAPNSKYTELYISDNQDKLNINKLNKKSKDKLLEETDKLPGFCLFLNIKDIRKINYFDEKFFFYFEDLDLCKRIKKIKKKIYLIKNISVNHNSSTESTTIMRNWNFYWGMFYYHKKHYGYLKTAKLLLGKIIRFFILKNLNYFYNKNRYLVYSARFDGLYTQYLNRESKFYKKFCNTHKILINNYNNN